MRMNMCVHANIMVFELIFLIQSMFKTVAHTKRNIVNMFKRASNFCKLHNAFNKV